MAYFQRISVMTNGVVVKHLLYNTWYNSRYNRYICTKSTIFCCFFIQKLYLCKPNPSLIKRNIASMLMTVYVAHCRKAKCLIMIDIMVDTNMGQKSQTFILITDNCLICNNICNRAGIEDIP